MSGAEQFPGNAMDDSHEAGHERGRVTPQPYSVPVYQAGPGTAWYHFLHGNVPNHEIDFMYRPVVPQGPLGRTHFGHLARLMRYIEPYPGCEYAFAIGNLSRDDTAHEPGRGGLGILFGFRIRGVTDHAGRRDPPFAHGMAAVDRRMDYSAILSASLTFFQLLFGKGEYDNPSSVLYREYVRYALSNPSVLEFVLKAYVADFDGVPSPEKTSLSLRYRADKEQPKRIVILHDRDVSFGDIAECAARIAAVLYTSNIRWTTITTGRDVEVPGGLTVRFVPKDTSQGINEDAGYPIVEMEDVPNEEEALAWQLFGAVPAGEEGAGMGIGAPVGELIEPPREFQMSARLSPEEIRAAIGLGPGMGGVAGVPVLGGGAAVMPPPMMPREDGGGAGSLGVWIGLGIGLIFAVVAVVLVSMSGGKEAMPEEPGASVDVKPAAPVASAVPSAVASGGPKGSVVIMPGASISISPSAASPGRKPGPAKKIPVKKKGDQSPAFQFDPQGL